MPKSPRVPSYCLHKGSGQAYVKVRGKRRYLGVHGTPTSHEAYADYLRSLLSGEASLPAASPPKTVTVGEVCRRYVEYANGYCVKRGKRTNEAAMIATACGHTAALFGNVSAERFGPLALKAVRDRMIEAGTARSTINAAINRIRRGFTWAAGEELIPATVPAALKTVPGLRAGRSKARETAPVMPVSDAIVEATLRQLPDVVADMVRLQRLTGMRPGEVCILRPIDLDRTGDVWVYIPESHKTEHHGRSRVVPIGPKGQSVLAK